MNIRDIIWAVLWTAFMLAVAVMAVVFGLYIGPVK